jgi:RimJ/RimL family protein N-acetyltransferase
MFEKKKVSSTAPSLVGKKLYLKRATADDIANTHHWTVMDEPQFHSFDPVPLLTAGEASAAYKNADSEAGQTFMIVTLKENTTVGRISFSELNWLNRSTRLGLLIDPDERKNDHGPEAVRLLCNYLFRYRGLNKVWAEVSQLNEELKTDLVAAGFHLDGTLRQHHFFRGEYHDVDIYSLLLFEFPV